MECLHCVRRYRHRHVQLGAFDDASINSFEHDSGGLMTEALKKMADNALLTAFFKLVTAVGVPITIACMLTAAGFTKLVP